MESVWVSGREERGMARQRRSGNGTVGESRPKGDSNIGDVAFHYRRCCTSRSPMLRTKCGEGCFRSLAQGFARGCIYLWQEGE
ncbi:MAG: hypothetical protein IKM62_00885 [Kiritimatiellae bacterium]|nr:hypothetical protein [Kiritimatiellia bacterium]